MEVALPNVFSDLDLLPLLFPDAVSWEIGEDNNWAYVPVASGWHYVGLAVYPAEVHLALDGNITVFRKNIFPLPDTVTLLLGKYFLTFGQDSDSIAVDDSISFRGHALLRFFCVFSTLSTN